MCLVYSSACGNQLILVQHATGAPPWSSGSVLDHRSLPPVFKSWRGHIWRLFRLSLRLITFGGRSAHLAYLVHKSGRKTSIIINQSIIIIQHATPRPPSGLAIVMHILMLVVSPDLCSNKTNKTSAKLSLVVYLLLYWVHHFQSVSLSRANCKQRYQVLDRLPP